ncbi:Bestrophin, RFP-TM, chloride channel [compost metagenome]
MYIYDSKTWFDFKFLLSKADTLRKMLPILIAIFIYCAVLGYLEIEVWQLSSNSWIKNINLMHTTLGFVISLLVVFRTNTAYDRWWEGRKLWGSLVNNSRNFAIKLASVLDSKDEEYRLFFRKYIPLYAESLKIHLQSESTRLSLDVKEHPELYILEKDKHIPNQVARILSLKVQQMYKDGILTDAHMINLNNELSALTDICGGCERIKNTPIPYSYSSFIKRFIMIYVITLPIGYVFQLGYYVAPLVTFIAYVLGSLELIAEEIEDPFGGDPNDLPLQKICNNIQKHVGEIL